MKMSLMEKVADDNGRLKSSQNKKYLTIFLEIGSFEVVHFTFVSRLQPTVIQEMICNLPKCNNRLVVFSLWLYLRSLKLSCVQSTLIIFGLYTPSVLH